VPKPWPIVIEAACCCDGLTPFQQLAAWRARSAATGVTSWARYWRAGCWRVAGGDSAQWEGPFWLVHRACPYATRCCSLPGARFDAPSRSGGARKPGPYVGRNIPGWLVEPARQPSPCHGASGCRRPRSKDPAAVCLSGNLTALSRWRAHRCGCSPWAGADRALGRLAALAGRGSATFPSRF